MGNRIKALPGRSVPIYISASFISTKYTDKHTLTRVVRRRMAWSVDSIQNEIMYLKCWTSRSADTGGCWESSGFVRCVDEGKADLVFAMNMRSARAYGFIFKDFTGCGVWTQWACRRRTSVCRPFLQGILHAHTAATEIETKWIRAHVIYSKKTRALGGPAWRERGVRNHIKFNILCNTSTSHGSHKFAGIIAILVSSNGRM